MLQLCYPFGRHLLRRRASCCGNHCPGRLSRNTLSEAPVALRSGTSLCLVALLPVHDHNGAPPSRTSQGFLLALRTQVEIYAIVRTKRWRETSHALSDAEVSRYRRDRASGRRVWSQPFYAIESLMLLDEVHSQQGEVAISASGSVAIAGGFSTTVIDSLSGSTIHTAKLEGRARATHISIDGMLLLTGSLDGHVSLTCIHQVTPWGTTGSSPPLDQLAPSGTHQCRPFSRQPTSDRCVPPRLSLAGRRFMSLRHHH